MIQLLGFGPLWGLPDLSPFPTKVEVYLRLSKIPFDKVPFSFERFTQAPKGKYPCIIDGDNTVADSGFIIEYLKKTYGDPLDARLSPEQRALGHVLRRMLEENYYWVIFWERWRDTDTAVLQYPMLQGLPPDAANSVVEKMHGEVQGQGLGRHTPEQIESIGRLDLTALSVLLGDRSYVLGDQPTSYDATVWSFVAHTIQQEYDSRMNRFVRTLPNLMAYWDRFGRHLSRLDAGV